MFLVSFSKTHWIGFEGSGCKTGVHAMNRILKCWDTAWVEFAECSARNDLPPINDKIANRFTYSCSPLYISRYLIYSSKVSQSGYEQKWPPHHWLVALLTWPLTFPLLPSPTIIEDGNLRRKVIKQCSLFPENLCFISWGLRRLYFWATPIKVSYSVFCLCNPTLYKQNVTYCVNGILSPQYSCPFFAVSQPKSNITHFSFGGHWD